MLELAHHFGVEHIIGITSHPDSDIRKLSTVVLNMGIISEPCPLGLTPTTSTTVMTVIGDALVVLMMKRIGFTAADYAKRHHGGYLGIKSRDAARNGR